MKEPIIITTQSMLPHWAAALAMAGLPMCVQSIVNNAKEREEREVRERKLAEMRAYDYVINFPRGKSYLWDAIVSVKPDVNKSVPHMIDALYSVPVKELWFDHMDNKKREIAHRVNSLLKR